MEWICSTYLHRFVLYTNVGCISDLWWNLLVVGGCDVEKTSYENYAPVP